MIYHVSRCRKLGQCLNKLFSKQCKHYCSDNLSIVMSDDVKDLLSSQNNATVSENWSSSSKQRKLNGTNTFAIFYPHFNIATDKSNSKCGGVVFYCWCNKKKAKPLYFIGAGEETNANISGFLDKTKMQMYPISWIKLNLTRVHIWERQIQMYPIHCRKLNCH